MDVPRSLCLMNLSLKNRDPYITLSIRLVRFTEIIYETWVIDSAWKWAIAINA